MRVVTFVVVVGSLALASASGCGDPAPSGAPETARVSAAPSDVAPTTSTPRDAVPPVVKLPAPPPVHVEGPPPGAPPIAPAVPVPSVPAPPSQPGPAPGVTPVVPVPPVQPATPPGVVPPQDPPRVPPIPEPPGTDDPKSPTDGWTDPYVGPNACQKCHFAQTKAWKKTPHAKALDALRPTAEADAERFRRKRDAGLDPGKDYTSDAACVPCHVTGHAAEGGFPALTSSEPADPNRAKAMGAVTCEACHGPGGRYVAHKVAEIARDTGVKFEPGSLAPLGLSAPHAATCRRCHNARSPTHGSSPLDFATDKAKVHPVPR